MRDYKELIEALRSFANSYVQMFGKGESSQLMDDAADAIEKLCKQLASCSKPVASCSKWISVDERLPEDGVFVLAANDDGKMLVSKYESEVLGWYLKYCCYDFDVWDSEENGPVTHWMTLPEPPKEDDNGKQALRKQQEMEK